MARSPLQRSRSKDILNAAEHLRVLLSSWVRTVRDRAGTPRSAQLETLRLLLDDGATTTTVLAAKRSVKHQSMRLVVEQLVNVGAVAKREDPSDRRNLIVEITAAGRSMLGKDQELRSVWIAQLLQDCTAAEIEEVNAAMKVLERLLIKASAPRF